MNEYKLMWDLPQFDVDSTANLVHCEPILIFASESTIA